MTYQNPYRTTIITKSADYTVKTTDSGQLFSNSASVNFTMPAAAKGLIYRFVVGTTAYLKVTATNGDTISYNGVPSAANGYTRSTTQGNQIEVMGLDSGEWTITSLDGTWTYDE